MKLLTGVRWDVSTVVVLNASTLARQTFVRCSLFRFTVRVLIPLPVEHAPSHQTYLEHSDIDVLQSSLSMGVLSSVTKKSN